MYECKLPLLVVVPLWAGQYKVAPLVHPSTDHVAGLPYTVSLHELVVTCFSSQQKAASWPTTELSILVPGSLV